eukprot:TRINITY_DN28338_c0_g1_i2.p1 TRINITY_DN28338_c0_g1~~TRINITY_DN28338_c0_g1_i2.p1  ORF type:complete len:608 (-),score=64.33 TRINITY_DN28338_c0_g1_i2:213-2036(-)
MRRIPWPCSEGDHSGTDWRDLVCNPFYGFRALEILCVMLVINAFRQWAADRHSQWKVEAELASSRIRITSTGSDEIISPTSPRHAASQVMFGVKRGVLSIWSIIFRLLLQVLQWWAVALLYFLYLLLGETLHIFRDFDLTIEDDTWWRFKQPDAFVESGMPYWLFAVSIHAILACLLIYAIALLCSVLQALTHVSEALVKHKLRFFLVSRGFGMLSGARDIAVQVLLAPMIYSLLCLLSVKGLWSIENGTLPDAVAARRLPSELSLEVQLAVIRSNFAVADIYMAWSLVGFGTMISKVLEPELRKKIKMDVVAAYERLLLIDLRVFVMVCVVSAWYSIALTWVKWRLGYDLCEVQPAVCSIQPYILGANLSVAIVAIYNLITVKRKFRKLEAMMRFGPQLKFYSIGLMIAISASGTLIRSALQGFLHVSYLQAQLLDASVRIYVMFIVVVLQVMAWWPWKDWYHLVRQPTEPLSEAAGELHSVGVKTVPRGTIALILALFPDMTEAEASEWSNVSTRIQELEPSDVYRVLYIGSQYGWAVACSFQSATPSKRVHTAPKRKRSFLGLGSAAQPSDAEPELPTPPVREMSLDDQKEAVKAYLQSLYPDE